jgi:hypothetical protein
MPQQVAAISLGLIERAAEREAMAHRRPHAGMPPQIEGCAGNTWGGQRPGARGQATPLQPHTGHGLTRRAHGVWIGHTTGVHHVNQSEVLDDRRDDASVVEAFHLNVFQCCTRP